MALRLARRQHRFPSNSSLIRFCSNSSSNSPPKVAANASVEKPSQSPSPSDSVYSPPFTDIKTTLKEKLRNQQEQGKRSFARSDDQAQYRGTFSDNPSRVSLQELGKNLARFQRRSTGPPLRDSGRGGHFLPQISLESLYKQNAAPNSADPRNRKSQDINLSNVLGNLKSLKTNTSNNIEKNGGYIRNFKSTGGEALPMSLFGKEMEREGETEEMMTEFLTFYKEEELGEKLRMLRPEGKKEEGWFSLQELNQRLVKLRQVEEKDAQNRSGNFPGLRNAIASIRNDTNKVISQQSNFILGHLGGVPEYKLLPPKEELVDTYFHPDNMSSAEKMKIELTKVRDEFKMSESDCGSARVQVAQLTTKIKHLSSSLHKKDKHSRKGLLGMVQKRKKLLKYLRRTDWDSYCLVLSKLSLRDNPDYKF